MCGAIAAGNCVMIKPSEISSHSATTMAELIPKYLDPECYQVALGNLQSELRCYVLSSKYLIFNLGGPAEVERLLEEKFDYIFYTGSMNVGKKFMLLQTSI